MDKLKEAIKTLTQQERKEVLDFIEDSKGYEKLLPSIQQYEKQLQDALKDIEPREIWISEAMDKLQERLSTHINWQPFDHENPPTNKDAGYLVETFNGGFVHCFATGKCFFVGGRIIDFKMVKAYAIINPSKF